MHDQTQPGRPMRLRSTFKPSISACFKGFAPLAFMIIERSTMLMAGETRNAAAGCYECSIRVLKIRCRALCREGREGPPTIPRAHSIRSKSRTSCCRDVDSKEGWQGSSLPTLCSGHVVKTRTTATSSLASAAPSDSGSTKRATREELTKCTNPPHSQYTRAPPRAKRTAQPQQALNKKGRVGGGSSPGGG